jgi:hypothetical protein
MFAHANISHLKVKYVAHLQEKYGSKTDLCYADSLILGINLF